MGADDKAHRGNVQGSTPAPSLKSKVVLLDLFPPLAIVGDHHVDILPRDWWLSRAVYLARAVKENQLHVQGQQMLM